MLKFSHILIAIATAGSILATQSVFAAGSAPVVSCVKTSVVDRTVTVFGTATDADNDLTKIEVLVDGRAMWLPASGTYNWSFTQKNLIDGPHHVFVRGFDTAGNGSVEYSEASFTVNSDGRSAPIIMCPKATVSGTGVTISGVSTGAKEVLVEFDGDGNWLTASGTDDWSITKNGLSPGSHSATIKALDAFHSGAFTTTAVGFTIIFPCTSTTANNVAHVTAGRAVRSGFTVLAKGSNAKMGYYNLFFSTKLSETSPGYFIVGSCPK